LSAQSVFQEVRGKKDGKVKQVHPNPCPATSVGGRAWRSPAVKANYRVNYRDPEKGRQQEILGGNRHGMMGQKLSAESRTAKKYEERRAEMEKNAF